MRFFVKNVNVLDDIFDIGSEIYEITYICPKNLECYKLLSQMYYNKFGEHPNSEFSFCDIVKIDVYSYPIYIFNY